METKKRVLAADRLEGIQTLHNVLGNSVEIVAATSLKEATRLMHETQVDMIICGIHFDESRMFELSTLAHGSSRTKPIPFLMFRDLESRLEPTFFKSLEISAKVIGAVGFVDLFSLKQQFGVPMADQQFREIIFKHL
jgi:CheY-like chemotaxis protein